MATKQASPGTQKFLGFIFALVGMGMLAGSWYTYDNTNKFVAVAQPAMGTVVDFETHHSSGSGSSGPSTTYAPVVEYTNPESGETVRFTSSTSSNPPAYDEGEEVKVLYDPADPDEARIDSFFSLWFLPLLLLVMGGIFLPVGLAVFRGAAKQKAL